MKLSSRDADTESLRVTLLADIRQSFTGERMFSKELIESLAQMSDKPWPEVCRGKPISERWLARNLSAFGIRPKLLRIGENDPARGYELVEFDDAFARYLPIPGNPSVTPLQHEGRSDFHKCYKNDFVTDQKIENTRECNGVTLAMGKVEQKKRVTSW